MRSSVERCLACAAMTSLLFAIGRALLGFIWVIAASRCPCAGGSLVALMVWAYYSAQIFLFGAVLIGPTQNRTVLRSFPARCSTDTSAGDEQSRCAAREAWGFMKKSRSKEKLNRGSSQVSKATISAR